jgi:hypothetical protein
LRHLLQFDELPEQLEQELPDKKYSIPQERQAVAEELQVTHGLMQGRQDDPDR